jgi:hypothetical protein
MVALHGRSEQFFAADPELLKRSLIIVLTRMQIRMHRYPHWYDCSGMPLSVIIAAVP